MQMKNEGCRRVVGKWSWRCWLAFVTEFDRCRFCVRAAGTRSARLEKFRSVAGHWLTSKSVTDGMGCLGQTYLEFRMSIKTQLLFCSRSFMTALMATLVFAACGSITGCQDGPMYAMKTVNPYYQLHEWKSDEAFGVTEHERRSQLGELAENIGDYDNAGQLKWLNVLNQIMDTDESPEMRRLAVMAAGNSTDPSALQVLEKGMDDDSVKVRMQACRGLGNQATDENVLLLASAVGSETSTDVKHAAMRALQDQASPKAVEALRLALSDRDPSTQNLAIASLRGATGKDYGDDPETWIAALDGQSVEERPTRFADRLRELF